MIRQMDEIANTHVVNQILEKILPKADIKAIVWLPKQLDVHDNTLSTQKPVDWSIPKQIHI